MPTTCGFPNCKFRSRYRGFEDNRHFYRVPKKPAILRHKWLEAIERTEATIVSQLRICSGHFHGGEKREGDIPVADPAVDPPRRIELPPKGVRFSSKGMSRAFKAHFRQSSAAISGSSCARSNRGGLGIGICGRPSGRYKAGLPAEYAGAYKSYSRPSDMPNPTLHDFYPITSRIFPSSAGTHTPSVDCIHQQGPGRLHTVSTNKHANFNPDNGMILPPISFLPPLSNIFRSGFQNAFSGETTSQGDNAVSFPDALDAKHLPLLNDLLKGGLQFLETGTTTAEVFAKHATPHSNLKNKILPEFNSMVLLWNSLHNFQTPPLHSLPPLTASSANLPAASAATASLPSDVPCVYGNLPMSYLISWFEQQKEFLEPVWPTPPAQSCALAQKCPRSAISSDSALDQETALSIPPSFMKFSGSTTKPVFCENRGEQPVTTCRSSNITYKGNRSKSDEGTTVIILGGPTHTDVESQIFGILPWIRSHIRIVHFVAGQAMNAEVPHGPVLAIVYDTEVINIEMLAQMDTLELIVLADLSSPVDRNDAVVSLLGSLGVPITVISPQTDIDATADALFTYIAILSQPVAAPRPKALQESEAAREWNRSVCADSTWRNSYREAPDGPPLTFPVTPSPRMAQASMMKEPLWEVADKRQSLGEKTLGLVGLDHVGLALARRSRAFGMRILVYDPYVPEGTAVGFGLQQVGHLSYLLAESDVVSIHWKPRSLSLRSVNIPVERDQVEPVNLDAAFMDAMKKDSILLYLDNDGPLDVKELGARLKDGRLPCVVMLDRVIARLPLHSQAALSELDSVFKLRSANLLTRHSLFNLRRQAATTVLTFLLSKRSDWSELTGHLLSGGQQQTQASSVEAGQLKPRKRTAEHRADADHRADSPIHRTCPKRGCGNLGAREAVARESSAPLYHDKPTYPDAATRMSFSIKALVTECSRLPAVDERRSKQAPSTIPTAECHLERLQTVDKPMSFLNMPTGEARVIKVEHAAL